MKCQQDSPILNDSLLGWCPYNAVGTLVKIHLGLYLCFSWRHKQTQNTFWSEIVNDWFSKKLGSSLWNLLFFVNFFWASKWWFFRSPLTEMTPYTPGAGFGELFADSSCMENLESTWFPTALLMVLCFCFVYLEPKWPWYWVQRAFFWTPKMEDKWVPGKCWLNKHYCAWLVDMSTDLGGCMRVRLKLGGSSNQWNASRYAGRFFRRATKNSLPIMINVMKQWLNFIVGGFFLS